LRENRRVDEETKGLRLREHPPQRDVTKPRPRIDSAARRCSAPDIAMATGKPRLLDRLTGGRGRGPKRRRKLRPFFVQRDRLISVFDARVKGGVEKTIDLRFHAPKIAGIPSEPTVSQTPTIAMVAGSSPHETELARIAALLAGERYALNAAVTQSLLKGPVGRPQTAIIPARLRAV
jgi:hypothetical protein